MSPRQTQGRVYNSTLTLVLMAPPPRTAPQGLRPRLCLLRTNAIPGLRTQRQIPACSIMHPTLKTGSLEGGIVKLIWIWEAGSRAISNGTPARSQVRYQICWRLFKCPGFASCLHPFLTVDLGQFSRPPCASDSSSVIWE